MSFIGLNFVLDESHKAKEDDKYDEVIDYLKNGEGPLTNPEIEVIGFLKTEASKEKHHYPDVELLITRDIYNKGKLVEFVVTFHILSLHFFLTVINSSIAVIFH